MANLWAPGQTPYVTPDQLASGQWPTGIDFTTIPPSSTATAAQKTAALAAICASATSQVDGYTNTPLRAVLDTEFVAGPDYRATYQQSTGNTRIILSRWPVTAITGIAVSPNAVFPRQWNTVPAGMWDIEHPVISLYGSTAPSGAGGGGQSVLLAPGYAGWAMGRQGYRFRVTYIAGWPHTSLTASVTPASPQTVSVDDCTGWGITGANGATSLGATIYDGASQESVTVTAASAASGPGTLTLASQLQFSHSAGVMVSALPANVIWATALYAGADALTRGATATVLRASPGGAGGPTGADELRLQADLILAPFRRTI